MTDRVCGSTDTADGEPCQLPPSRADDRCRHHTRSGESSTTSRETERPYWSVPAGEWQQFKRFVERKHGAVDGYLSREAERAVKEYADADEYADVEQRVTELLEAAGLDDDQDTGAAVDTGETALANATETITQTARIDQQVLDAFKSVARQSDDRLGVEYAKALREYREGGRAGRLESNLEQLLATGGEITTADQDVDQDATPDGMNRSEKVDLICARLDQQFTDDELIATIDEIASRDGRSASAPIHRDYRELVTEQLDVEPHPETPDVWVPRETARELAGEGVPDVCRRPVGRLDKSERVDRIRLEAGRRAALTPDGIRVTESSTVRQGILQGEVSDKTARTYMKEAADLEGIDRMKVNGEAAIRVNLEQLGSEHPYLLDEILEYRESQKDDVGDPEQSTLPDHQDGDGPEQVSADAVRTERPTAAADGGQRADSDEIELSASKRQLLIDIGGDPDDPEHRRAAKEERLAELGLGVDDS